jgi:hypothetical protein
MFAAVGWPIHGGGAAVVRLIASIASGAATAATTAKR